MVTLGGDGRNNQIYLAIWSAQRKESSTDPTEISINCIEEPEAHLHPHQQRKLTKYLVSQLDEQLILTSHSPQIACEFEKNSIACLSYSNVGSISENQGCSNIIRDVLSDFGHRLNLIPAEGFFSDVVFLVEGISDLVFYKALAHACGIDLDRFNISIVPVEGIGFDVFLNVYLNLGVKCVIKTDLDIVKIKNSNSKFRISGLNRAIQIYSKFHNSNVILDSSIQKLDNKQNSLQDKKLDIAMKSIVNPILDGLKDYGIFISNIDLESNLADSEISAELNDWYKETDKLNSDKTYENKKGKKYL